MSVLNATHRGGEGDGPLEVNGDVVVLGARGDPYENLPVGKRTVHQSTKPLGSRRASNPRRGFAGSAWCIDGIADRCSAVDMPMEAMKGLLQHGILQGMAAENLLVAFIAQRTP